MKNVLIACECSGEIRRAFRARGHNAYSCDLKPAEDGSPFHIQGDALEILKRGCEVSPGVFAPWDLVIAHPVCTRLANSGSLRLYKGGKFDNGVDIQKWDEMTRAALFFRQFFVLPEGGPWPKLCVENPIQHIHAREMHACGKPTQIIQPFNFGEDASKATALWLRDLTPLRNTSYFPPRLVCKVCGETTLYDAMFNTGCIHCGALPSELQKRWGNQTNSGQNKLGPSDHRAADRSRTYPGIAEAMADQWGPLL